MNIELQEEKDDKVFLSKLAKFLSDIGDKSQKAMNPERNFLINGRNREKVKLLLSSLEREKILQEQASDQASLAESRSSVAQLKLQVLETFTNLLYEALQFVGIIPNHLLEDLQSEQEQMREMAEEFNRVKNELIDLKNKVA